MDPNIWGPLVWNIIFDVCWFLENYNKNIENTTWKGICIFFQCWKWLLPCKYCRSSYKHFLNQMNNYPPKGKGALLWGYKLKDLVNQKLNKPSISYDLFIRRMKTWTSISSTNNYWDLLYILSLNFKDQPRKKHFLYLLITESFLPLLNIMPLDQGQPMYKSISYVFQYYKLNKEKDLKNQKSFIKYLCKCKTLYNQIQYFKNQPNKNNKCENNNITKLMMKERMKKYSHCKASLTH